MSLKFCTCVAIVALDQYEIVNFFFFSLKSALIDPANHSPFSAFCFFKKGLTPG